METQTHMYKGRGITVYIKRMSSMHTPNWVIVVMRVKYTEIKFTKHSKHAMKIDGAVICNRYNSV